jgi:AcrR family transcriptional regulator
MVEMEMGQPALHGKPPGRRERKKKDTRRRIFRAAIDLFLEKGFDATTIEEIAEKADVAKGTVFNYFRQKTEFLVAAYREWIVLIRSDLGPVESWSGPARSQLDRVFGYLTDLATAHRSLARQVVFENMRQTHLRMTRGERKTGKAEPGPMNQEDEGCAENDSEAVRLLEDMTMEVVRRGMEAGEVRKEVDLRHVASLIAAAAFHTLVRGLIRGDSAAEIKAALGAKLDIIFRGLAPGAEK